jgi:hypothetical protein
MGGPAGEQDEREREDAHQAKPYSPSRRADSLVLHVSILHPV